MTARPLPYPPPWQDAATLCAHLCISDRTLDAWVKKGVLPAGRLIQGKRMWEWAKVECWLKGDGDIVDEADLVRRVHDATKAAASG